MSPWKRENGLRGASDCSCRVTKVSMCSSFCGLIHNNGSLKINYYSVIRGFHAEKLPSLDVVNNSSAQVSKMALRRESGQRVCITETKSKHFTYAL